MNRPILLERRPLRRGPRALRVRVNVAIQQMRPFSLDSALLFLVELKRLRLKTLISSSPRHGRAECVSDPCLPIYECSIAVEGHDPRWFQAILSPRFPVYSC